MMFWVLIAITFIFRLLLSSLFPLTADESYYWLWSKHLSLSYVDHPPMVALVNYLFSFGRENLLLVRLGAVLITTLVTIIIYLLAKEAFSEKAAFWSAVLFQSLPHFVVVWLTQFVELPLALFWSLSLLILFRIIKFHNSSFGIRHSALWVSLGLTVGLGTLSKYTMFLFWPCLTLFFILSPEHRFWLKRAELYVCLLLTVFCFLPVIYWNSQHAWASFTFHSGQAAGAAWGENFLPFIGDQLVHFTPFFIFALFSVFRSSFRSSFQPFNPSTFFISFSFPVLFLFLALSLKIKVWAHWPSIGYIAALPLTVNYLLESKKSITKFIAWITGFSLLLLLVLFFISPAILLHQKDYAQNYKLGESIPSGAKVFAKTNVSASLLEFYLKRPAYLATGLLKPGPLWGEKQYELWGIPNLKSGETIYYFGEDNGFFRERALQYFEEIEELPDVKLYLVEDYITNNYKMFKLKKYKKDSFHP